MKWGWRLGVLALLLVGCAPVSQVTLRELNEELALLDPQEQMDMLRQKSSVDRIGDAVRLEGTEPVALSWYSLVVGLGTNGTRDVPDWQIEPDVMLRNELLKRLYVSGFSGSATEIMRSLDSAPVSVTALVPPLARANDRVDVHVEAIGGNTRSLRGGLLVTTPLRQVVGYGGGRPSYGNVWAEAEGKLTLSAGRLAFDEGGMVNELVAHVPGGSSCQVNGFLGLRLQRPNAYAARLTEIALNERFPNCAQLLSRQAVRVVVPGYYRDEWQHFAQVVQEVRCRLPRGRPLRSYISALVEDLHGDDPVLARQAALKLEAVGPEAVPALEGSLRSPRPAVRLAAATALAAMREPAGILPLTNIIDTSTDDAERRSAAQFLNFYTQRNVRDYQKKLLADRDPEVRYRALLGLERTQEEGAFAVHETAGEGNFRITRVASVGSPALVVKARNPRRLVLFGEPVSLRPPFTQSQLGDLTLEARDSSKVTILYRVYNQPNELPIRSMELMDLVRGLDKINVTINDIMDLIFKLSRADAINGEVLFLDE